ncbi:MAG: cytochrome c peroxidase [Pseudomonadota bacterium]
MLAAFVTALSLAGAGWLYPVWRVSSAGEQRSSVAQASLAADVFIPLPQALALDGRKVKLGERLFRDRRLSSDGSVSCSSCHDLDIGGVDRLPRSRGIGGREGGINAPTVFNSGFNFRQFWNGRAATLEDQIDGPLQNPIEMGNTWPQALATIAADAQYRGAFNAIYPDGIQSNNVKDAIATFERSLITPNSRFDRFLRGDQNAMSPRELAGYALFRRIGCTSCHQGINIGGNMYQKLGIMEDYFAVRGNLTEADLGRFIITQREEDRYYFKVPSLRNVAMTPPYLHDSSAETLEDVVQVMARFQLGRKLEARDVNSIVAFLRTLTGEYSGKPLQ